MAKQPIKNKREKLKLLNRPYKKAHIYKDIEEAKQGLHGSPSKIERVAQLRLKAQKIHAVIKKEGIS